MRCTYILTCFVQVSDDDRAARASVDNINQKEIDTQMKAIYDILDSIMHKIGRGDKVHQGIRILAKLSDCIIPYYNSFSKKVSVHCSLLEDFSHEYLKLHRVPSMRRFDVGINIITGKTSTAISRTKPFETGAYVENPPAFI